MLTCLPHEILGSAYEKADVHNFYFATYADFNNVIMMRPNGYINVSKLCADNGKNFKKWSKMEHAKALVAELDKKCDEHTLKSIKIGTTQFDGICAQPLRLPFIASWILPSFAFKVSEVFNGFLANHFQYLCGRVNDRVDEMREENNKHFDQNLSIQQEIAMYTSDVNELYEQKMNLFGRNKNIELLLDHLTHQGLKL